MTLILCEPGGTPFLQSPPFAPGEKERQVGCLWIEKCHGWINNSILTQEAERLVPQEMLLIP